MRKGTVAPDRSNTVRSASTDAVDRDRALPTPGNLNKLFSRETWFGYSDEQGAFTGEPPRADLTRPPPGYQTPSPGQPYGVTADKKGLIKVPTLFDRGGLNN